MNTIPMPSSLPLQKTLELKTAGRLILAAVFMLTLISGCASGSYESGRTATRGGLRKVFDEVAVSPSDKRKRLRSKLKPLSKKKMRRLVQYTGRLGLVVPDVDDALKKTRMITEKFKGYIQSSESSVKSNRARIFIRVPTADFFPILAALAKIGKVENRQIRARDITRAFYNTKTRLLSARRARDRLYVLLRKTKDMKERIAILKEISRLRRFIELLNARMKRMRNKVDYATVILSLKRIRHNALHGLEISPFRWIRRISPWKRSIFKISSLPLQAPRGFFNYENRFKSRNFSYLYRAPDGTFLRKGMTKNVPMAPLSFWTKALQLEMKKRGWTLLSSQKSAQNSNMQIIQYKVERAFQNRYYTLLLLIRGKSIHVVEAYYPNEKIWKSRKGIVAGSLQKFGTGEKK